ncbi:heat shock 70 kDa protein 12A-like [Dreissena polymorpha]|uniref:Actin-like ATPase domain-containing protein n=1 Tax=Dreissena polymorpha TaxID=45954 RepID=A0A9D4DFR0_DREPO|nr:heat shock 70 kDa protein 12A-like [Dreissena polymorpha]KAH3748161.1 hypothetical protein DPMN_182599 [Dreissena polymorpha]
MGNCYSSKSRVHQLTVAAGNGDFFRDARSPSGYLPRLENHAKSRHVNGNVSKGRNGLTSMSERHNDSDEPERDIPGPEGGLSLRRRHVSREGGTPEYQPKRSKTEHPMSADTLESIDLSKVTSEQGLRSTTNTSRATLDTFSVTNTSRIELENISEKDSQSADVPRANIRYSTPATRSQSLREPSDSTPLQTARSRGQKVQTGKPGGDRETLSRGKEDRIPPSVIAIEIGTSSCGYAYWYNSRNTISVPERKMPSVILLNPDSSLNSFGHDAMKNYSEIPEDKRQEYFYIVQFKSCIFAAKRITQRLTVFDSLGRAVNAFHTFSLAIRWLKERATANVAYDEATVHWVLTIPAVWAADLRRFMRSAALRVGIPDVRLDIYLEPEAASYFCRDMYVAMSNEKLTPGIKYAFADIGGGTVSIYVHEILKGSKIRELYRDTHHGLAGEAVNKAYIRFWVDVVGEELWDEFLRRHTNAYLKMLVTFEKKKIGFSRNRGERTDVLLPPELDQLLKLRKWASFDAVLKRKPMYTGRVQSKDVDGSTFVFFSIDMMEDFFADAIAHIVGRVLKAITVCFDFGIMGLVLTGGFAQSPYLLERLEFEFDELDVRVIIPEEKELAVLKGAAMMGNDPVEISERRSMFSYGYSQAMSFVEGKALNGTGKTRRLLFRTLVERDQCLKNNTKLVIQGQEVVSNPNKLFAQRHTRLVKSSCEHPAGKERNGMREEDCEAICEFVHTPPTNGWPIRMLYEMTVLAKETELKFVYENKTTGEKMKTYLSLL